MSRGLGRLSHLNSDGSESSSSMISLQRSMHSSQMYTPGPAMSFLTCFWLFPQNEHFSRSPPSPMRATQSLLYPGTSRILPLRRPYLGAALEGRQNIIHDSVVFRLVRVEEPVPLDVTADLVRLLPGVLGDDLLHRAAHPQDLPGLDLQVAGLPVAALQGRLVQQDPRVRQ